jgi:membrane AbrB-like protein
MAAMRGPEWRRAGVDGSNRAVPSLSASFAKLPRAAQWTALAALTAAFVVLLELAGLPAAFLLGPMIAAIIVATNGGAIRIFRPTLFFAQTIIGCLVARAITPEIIGTFSYAWPLILGIACAILAMSMLLGWLLARLGVLPGTTAVWGTAPGAASAMMLMSADFGADPRMVAFMQYLRVVIVAGVASLLARFWIHVGAAAHPEIVWFPPIDWVAFAETLVLALGGGFIGRWLKIPAGGLLVPMAVGALLHGTGLMKIELPQWLLAASYAFLGWNIGLGFTREILKHAARALPQTLLSIFALVAFSALLALVLVKTMNVDPLTAYLGTSPGGMDSVAIIAASSPVDVPFVMALQTMRFLIVLIAGPPLARFVAGQLGRTRKRRLAPGEKKALQKVRQDEPELD